MTWQEQRIRRWVEELSALPPDEVEALREACEQASVESRLRLLGDVHEDDDHWTGLWRAVHEYGGGRLDPAMPTLDKLAAAMDEAVAAPRTPARHGAVNRRPRPLVIDAPPIARLSRRRRLRELWMLPGHMRCHAGVLRRELERRVRHRSRDILWDRAVRCVLFTARTHQPTDRLLRGPAACRRMRHVRVLQRRL